MSLLKTIKGTFKNVQDDISESLKALTVTPEKQKTPDPQPLRATTVNYDAGAEILHRNENIWRELYQYTEMTGQRAQDVDVQIGNLFLYVDKQSEILLKTHNEVSGLPKLIMQLQEITNVLAQVEEEYDKVEAALVHLENICEEQEYRRNVASHHNQLAVYKMKKEHELDNYKVQLAQGHALKVENLNKRKQHMLHEKQVAYEEEFAKDIDYFKKHGKPGRSPSTPESVKKLDISDVEIEEDSEALNAFLESSDTPASDSKENSQKDNPMDIEEQNNETITVITSPSESTSEITSPDGGGSDNQSETNTALPEEGTSSAVNEIDTCDSKQLNEDGTPTTSDKAVVKVEDSETNVPKDSETDNSVST